MRIRKTMAVSIAGLSLAAAATLPALAASSHPAAGKHGTFPSKLTPTRGIHPGDVLTLKSTQAHKNKGYTCAFAAVWGKKHAANTTNITSVTSSKHGHFHCSLTFHKFHGTIKGKTVHCPQTRKDRRRGVKCGMAAADPFHSLTDNTIQYFKSHR
jgi:hypothetical protein